MSDGTGLTPRELVTDVFGARMTREIWSHSYEKVLPISVLDFDLSAVLPAVFYMFRFGQRRGPGHFVDTFGPADGTKSHRRHNTTVHSVASILASKRATNFQRFEGEVEGAILGDLLLCYCLENLGYALGRSKPIQRVAPTHYMAAWVDLPDYVGHLRHVPETIVAILADQKKTAFVQATTDGKRTWFPVVGGADDDLFAKNVMLSAFSKGMHRGSTSGNYAADDFDERETVGMDQFLTIRIAQALGAAPRPMQGQVGRIPNTRPIATGVTRAFSEDMRKFVRRYASIVPRQAFLEMTESCMAVGLASIVAGVVEVVLGWAATGKVVDESPSPVFVDSSGGTDRELRSVAEQSMDDYLRKLERLPVVLMALRLLDYRTRNSSAVRKLLLKGKLPSSPVAKEWIAFLGAVLHGQRPESRRILDSLEDLAQDLAEASDENGYPAAFAEELRNDDVQRSPVWRLAEVLTAWQGRKVHTNTHKLVDSSLHIDRPNGLATKRRIRGMAIGSSGQQSRMVRCMVFTDSVLEYLVHRHVLPSGSGKKLRTVSFGTFLGILRERYGFYVDQAPPGLTVSNALLQANRSCLERRLRELGLLVGVNDAEAMKRLRPRFEADKS